MAAGAVRTGVAALRGSRRTVASTYLELSYLDNSVENLRSEVRPQQLKQVQRRQRWRALEGEDQELLLRPPPSSQVLAGVGRRVWQERDHTDGCGRPSNFFDEDPVVISHLMWSYFNANLTGAAMEIFNNVSDFQGLEVWRKMSQKINVWGERRRDELAEVVNNPKPAGKPEDLAKMIEAWDTSHRQFLACGGQALMEYDRLRILRKMVPQQLLNEMIARDFRDYQAAKEWALEMARRLVVQGRHSKLLLAEVHTITDEFMERTEGWDFDQQLQELGAAGEADVILALVARRTTWRSSKGGKGKGKDGKGKSKDDKGKSKGRGPTTKAGKPLCTNC